MKFHTYGKINMRDDYYSLKKILSYNAKYYVIFGERSNGKTYSVLKHGVEKFAKSGEQLAIVRRWADDFTGKRGKTMFDGLVCNAKGVNEIKEITKGEWTNVYYYGSMWYLCRFEEDGTRTMCEKPLAYGFAISGQEHDKSTSYPEITTILFDEFLSRSLYLQDEFVLFMNVISTIKRRRQNVEIFMLGNTINKYCPYFAEMGLRHARDMKPGTIDIYKYGNSDLIVAVERTKSSRKDGEQTDSYFAFDNQKLQMITGGEWEIDIYPHCPCKFLPKEILFTYFIVFDYNILQCEIVLHDDLYFTFIHRKTTPLKDEDNDLIFTPEYSPRPNYSRKITKPRTELEKKIADFYLKDKVFYADNEIGEVVRNYLMWSGKAGV